MPEALHKPERQRTPTKMVVVVVVVVVVVPKTRYTFLSFWGFNLVL